MTAENRDYDNLRRVVGEAIGEASMCWSEPPLGVFDSTRASAIVDRVLAAVDPLKKVTGFSMAEVGEAEPPPGWVIRALPGWVMIRAEDFREILDRLLETYDAERVWVARRLMDAAVGTWVK